MTSLSGSGVLIALLGIFNAGSAGAQSAAVPPVFGTE
jgi:hypothetical protein